MDVKAHLLELALQHPAARGVELRLHHVRHEVDDVDLEAAVQQAAGRFEAEQAAADHRRAAHAVHEGEHAVAVVQRAEDEDAALEASRLACSRAQPVHRREPAAGCRWR